MDRVRFYKDSLSYDDIIRHQLERVAEARSFVFIPNPDNPIHPFEVEFKRYLHSVEALYALLLPGLRGDSAQYLRVARRLYNILMSNKTSEWKKRELERVLREAPEPVARAVREARVEALNPGHWVILLIDRALEELIAQLNASGLLFRSGSVKVGVVNVPRRAD